jgi:hydroxyethylthiazole kinase-like sugar kinase family protein
MSLAKDRSLTVVVTGKRDAVRQAHKMVVLQMQKQVLLCSLLLPS